MAKKTFKDPATLFKKTSACNDFQKTSFVKIHKTTFTEEAAKALERIMAFNPGLTKKDVVSNIILEAVKQYKGRKPPKGKKQNG
jgi:hypothetical protein